MSEEVVASPTLDVVGSTPSATTSADNPAEGVPNAQDPEASAPPAQPGEVTPETPEQAEKRRQRSFGRKLDKAYRRAAEAEAKAKFLEEQNAKFQERQPKDDGAPKLENFTDIEEFRKAVEKHASERTAKEFESKRAAENQQQYVQRVAQEWQKKVAAVAEKYPDFATVANEVSLSTPALYAMMEAENGPDIAHYLGSHDEEAEKVAAMSVSAQIRAIGRLEAKLAAEPAKPKQPSKAPAPITPVGGKSGGANDAPQDTDDIKTWMKKEEARVKKLAG